MRRILFVPLLLLALLGGGGAVAAADPSPPPDVSHQNESVSFLPVMVAAAGFTAPTSGRLARLELDASPWGGSVVEGVSVAIAPVVDGVPATETVVGSLTLHPGQLVQTVTLDGGVALEEGRAYAIVVRSPVPMTWSHSVAPEDVPGWIWATGSWQPLQTQLWDGGTVNFAGQYRGWIEPMAEEPPPAPVLTELNGTLAGSTTSAKAGSTLPLRWRVLLDGAPVSVASASLVSDGNCGGVTGTPAVVETSPGRSGLSVEGDGYHQLNWRTVAGRVGCRNVTLSMTLADGTTLDHTFEVTFRR